MDGVEAEGRGVDKMVRTTAGADTASGSAAQMQQSGKEHGSDKQAGVVPSKQPGLIRGYRGRTQENLPVDSMPIPRSLAEFSEADKIMWDMRKAGRGWEEIRVEWERLTGQKVGGTTLPNRYVRIKDNIGDFSEEDDELLLRCKKELENTFSDEIWSMVSEAMTSRGGNKFSGAAIKKRFQQLSGNQSPVT